MLQSKDEIMAKQLKQTVDDIKEYSRGKEGLKAIIVLRIIATALITIIFTASDVIRIVCRKEQGKEEISYIRLGISAIAFLAYKKVYLLLIYLSGYEMNDFYLL